MSEQLSCLVCGRNKKGEKLAILKTTGLDTLLACSLERSDDLQSRVKINGQNAVHEKCRSSYTKSFNKAKTSGLNSAVDDVFDLENDFTQEPAKVADISLFHFSKLCIICAENCAKSTNLKSL